MQIFSIFQEVSTSNVNGVSLEALIIASFEQDGTLGLLRGEIVSLNFAKWRKDSFCLFEISEIFQINDYHFPTLVRISTGYWQCFESLLNNCTNNNLGLCLCLWRSLLTDVFAEEKVRNWEFSNFSMALSSISAPFRF